MLNCHDITSGYTIATKFRLFSTAVNGKIVRQVVSVSHIPRLYHLHKQSYKLETFCVIMCAIQLKNE